MKLTEDKLSSAIRAGNIDKLYFLYGKEPFLINMHTDRIIKKTVGEDALDFNLQRLDGNPEPDVLSDYIESLPVFAERKVITVKDYDPPIRQYSSFTAPVSRSTRKKQRQRNSLLLLKKTALSAQRNL